MEAGDVDAYNFWTDLFSDDLLQSTKKHDTFDLIDEMVNGGRDNGPAQNTESRNSFDLIDEMVNGGRSNEVAIQAKDQLLKVKHENADF